jgi:hypothetical protein
MLLLLLPSSFLKDSESAVEFVERNIRALDCISSTKQMVFVSLSVTSACLIPSLHIL